MTDSGARDGEGDGPKSVIRPTDEAALTLAGQLLHDVRHAALAVLEPGTGHPLVSRVLVGLGEDGCPVILISKLALHTKSLLADSRCSLLIGEPGKGDPMAWPRMTVLCKAVRLERDSELDRRIRERFLKRHPKAKLYAGFPDFSFFRLVPESANLNGGFGNAYIISGDALTFHFGISKG